MTLAEGSPELSQRLMLRAIDLILSWPEQGNELTAVSCCDAQAEIEEGAEIDGGEGN